MITDDNYRNTKAAEAEVDNYIERLAQLKILFTDGTLAQSYVFHGQEIEKILNSTYELALHVLEKSAVNPYGFTAEQTIKFISQNIHPNFFLLTASEKGKEIIVEDARNMSLFLQNTPAIQGWRFVTIFPADSLNNAASNAILKNLEELPNKVTVVLVASSLSRIKPTILSRSQKVFFSSAQKTVQDYIAENPLAKQIINAIDNAWQKGLLPDKNLIDAIIVNNETMSLFKNVALTYIYENICTSVQESDSKAKFAQKYEKVANFITAAENKSLAPAHLINAVFILLV
jgi:DNA polymerase III delta prime subunit